MTPEQRRELLRSMWELYRTTGYEFQGAEEDFLLVLIGALKKHGDKTVISNKQLDRLTALRDKMIRYKNK